MTGNIRNSRTTHPRKAARRQRASERFYIKADRADRDVAYLQRKCVEATALGLPTPINFR
jgi:hypothetical protein